MFCPECKYTAGDEPVEPCKCKCPNVNREKGWRDCWNFTCRKNHSWRSKEIREFQEYYTIVKELCVLFKTNHELLLERIKKYQQ